MVNDKFSSNGDKGEFYLDAYKKFENQCIRLMDICGEDD